MTISSMSLPYHNGGHTVIPIGFIIQYLYFVHNKRATFFLQTTLHSIKRKKETVCEKQSGIKIKTKKLHKIYAELLH